MKKAIFISGGSGFIGKHLLENLPDKYSIFAPTHKELNLLNKEAVKRYFKSHKSFDTVIHCSNIGGTRDTLSLPNVAVNNLKMFFNLVSFNKRFKQMIFLGSGAEYDKRYPIIKIKENSFDRSVPEDEYGFSKYLCSKYIEETENILNLRLFGVYGKYENYKLRFISYAICKNILGLPIIINQNVFFDYLYVNDLVKIIDLFIQKFPQEKFLNIGRGKKIDLLTIAKRVNFIAEKKSKIIVKKGGLQNEYTCDNTLFMKTAKNFTFTDFTLSLKELYSYYKSIKASLKMS